MATPKKSFPKGCLLAFFAIFVLAGIGVVIAGLYDLYEKRIRAKRMKPVEVTILSSEVSVSTSSDSTSYYFDVEFEYELDGKKFVADKYALGVRSSLKRRECNRLIKKYKVGETYTGYYDPESPDYAVLNIDPDNTYLFFILFGAAFIVVPIIAYRSITTARARAEERRRELIENRISRPSTNANPWLLCAVGLVVGGGGVLFLGVGGDEIQGAPRYFVMGFIGIGFLVFLGGLMAFPRHRMMNATSMAFEHAPYAPGEQVRFILFDPSGAVARQNPELEFVMRDRKTVGRRSHTFFQKLQDISWEQRQVQGKNALVGIAEIPATMAIPPEAVTDESFYPEMGVLLKLKSKYKYFYEIPVVTPQEHANQMSQKEHRSDAGENS